MKILLLALIILNVACKKETEIPYFRSEYPNQEQIDACKPGAGGTIDTCLALTRSVRLGVAISQGIGPNRTCAAVHTPPTHYMSDNRAAYVAVYVQGNKTVMNCDDTTDDESCELLDAINFIDDQIAKGACLF